VATRPWLRLYTLVAVPLCLLYVALPDPPRYLWTAIGLLSLAGLVVGTVVNNPRRRLPWWLATAGVAALMLGDATYDLLTGPLGQDNPFPSAADALYLAMYPLIAGGLLVLIRVTNPFGDRHAALDATVVTVALGLLVWVYLAEPYVQDATMTWVQKAVSIGYPLGDVLILAVLVRLLIGGGRRTRALWLLSIGTVGLLGSDVVYGLIQLNGSWSTGGVVDSGWMLFYVAWGAAALSPDMTRLTEPVRPGAVPTSRHRLLVFTMVPLAAPGLQLWNISQGVARHVPVTAVAAAALFLLVALRLRGLVDAARHATERENALRRTGEALVAASDPDTVYRVGLAAIGDITGRSPRLLVATGSPLGLAFDSAHPEGPTGAKGLDPLARRYEHELRRHQFVLTTAARCGPALSAVLGPDATVLLAAMVRGEQISGLLVVIGPGVDRPETIDPVCTLASQVMLALDSIELTVQVAERRSEAHFRSLFQNAADIILVLDEKMGLLFNTPSAQSVLGWDPADGQARSIDTLVVAGDAARARLLLGRVLSGEWQSVGGPADEWRIRDRHGVVRQYEVSCRNLINDPSVGGVVVTLHDITERRKLESDLKHQAFHDSLTQLPNRALFLDRVEHALARSGRHRERLAVILIDLDNFKVINDTRGHAAGDALLLQVAQRLQSVMRAEDSCARLGGDEFAILAEGLVTDEEAGQLADRLVEQLRMPFEIGGESVTAGASIGVSTSDYGANASELLLQADLAMYAAKDAGKGGTQFFRPELIDVMQLRARTVSELDKAVERDEFVLYYQPIVALDTGGVIGVEALLRWQHPERGLLFPDDFIDIVEESDLAVAVGAWVIDHAVAQAAEWQRFAPADDVLKMSLNVAPRELSQPGFVDTVVAALHRHGLPSRALVLEITERMLAGKDPQIAQAMAELEELGVRLAVDDFGTGYAALGYLRRFPVSTLKIDRSFVAGLGHSPDDHALVEAIIRLGETFDLDLIAEGVETEGQRVELLRMGCRFAQGFHYSRALPAEDAATFIRTRPSPESPESPFSIHPMKVSNERFTP
jgi:diguanylate cyclase (GGDEF)-like protein/PAS domain S-box-containing protein